jgi:hypothetical protein
LANKLLSLTDRFEFNIKLILLKKEKAMTYEQWVEEMKKGSCLQIDEKTKSPTRSDDHSNWETEEEESPNFSLEQN